MKFQPDTLSGVNVISRLDPDRVVVGAEPHGHSVLVPWVGTVSAWPVSRFEDLLAEHFDAVVALRPELVILGTGARHRFPPASLLRSLIERRIGFESMDTAAACRTYNVLVTERRSVLAALILEPAAP